MADNRKLAAGLRNLPASAREDLAGREQDIQRGKTVELLRRAGKEMYDNPIVNTAIGFTPVLGDIQAAGETMAALNRGAPWQETAGYAAGMLPFMPMIGKTVWHGSPHTFEKFDLSKIGTGEGAQAYGHGLYLAESPEVAEGYRKTLSPNELIKQGEKIPYQQMDTITAGVANDIASKNGDIQAVRQMYQDMANQRFGGDVAKQRLAALDAMGNDVGVERGGSLYKVDLPDDQIAKMLDWDKPLSEQPEAYAAIQKYAQETQYNPENALKSLEGKSGGEAYSMWSDPKYVSQFLNEQGVPGIQYLDQASRGAGEGTRNYVVFSDEIPQILERNNQPVAQALREYKQLESLNPTGTVMTEYNPLERASLPLGKNLTTLDVTSGVSPDEMVEIYRGVPQGVSEISPGDFITTNRQLAQDYAGGGNVISQKVPYRTILDDLTEPLGEEYIYRP